MRLSIRGTSPKTDARGSRQLPWSRVIFEDWGAAARQSQTVGTSANPSTSRSGGSFLRPPRPFDRHRSVALEDIAGERLGMQAPRSRPPDRYHSPSKRPHNRRAPRGAIARNRSSDRRDRDPASPGVRDFRPSTDVSNARPLPDRARLRTRPGGSEEPRCRRHHPSSIPLRPRGFAPPRRFSPREGPRACCIPLPVLGFAAFPETRSHGPVSAPRGR
jgi:hypothetical protein